MKCNIHNNRTANWYLWFMLIFQYIGVLVHNWNANCFLKYDMFSWHNVSKPTPAAMYSKYLIANTPQSQLFRWSGIGSTMTTGQGSLYVDDLPLLSKKPVLSNNFGTNCRMGSNMVAMDIEWRVNVINTCPRILEVHFWPDNIVNQPILFVPVKRAILFNTFFV